MRSMGAKAAGDAMGAQLGAESGRSAPGARWTGSGLPLPLALRRLYRYR